MGNGNRQLLVCWVFLVVCGCGSGSHPSDAGAGGPRSNDLVGKWRLVRADGKSPPELSIKSHELDPVADGTWTSKIEMGGSLDGMTLWGGGKWSLADGVVNYSNGQESGTSRFTLNGERLVLDPDFHLRKNDATKAPITTEYERER